MVEINTLQLGVCSGMGTIVVEATRMGPNCKAVGIDDTYLTMTTYTIADVALPR